MPYIHAIAAALALLAAGSAHAQQARDLCADRPGLGTPPCTIDTGRTVVEVGLADLTRMEDGVVRIDTVTAGDLLVRIGLADRIEGQVGWTSYGHRRMRDRVTNAVSFDSRRR